MTKQKFKDLLWTVYFTDEMGKSFPTPMVKGMAFSAMVYLWEAKELEVCGRTLTRDEIRYILFEKLSPCEFQYAIERFVKLYRKDILLAPKRYRSPGGYTRPLKHKYYQNLYHRKWLNPSQTNAKNGARTHAKLKRPHNQHYVAKQLKYLNKLYHENT